MFVLQQFVSMRIGLLGRMDRRSFILAGAIEVDVQDYRTD